MNTTGSHPPQHSYETSSRSNRNHDDDDYLNDDNDHVELIESNRSTVLNATNHRTRRCNKRTATNGRILKNSTLCKSLFLLIVVGYIWYHKTNNIDVHYCYDSDDSDEFIQQFIDNPKLCSCVNPDVPIPRNETIWYRHHNIMVQDVLYHASKQQLHEEDVDFVLVGDSITEAWNGTRNVGRRVVPENRAIFDKYFNKYDNANNASLFGLALGLAGDVSVELLWHLENGILSSNITPKVFVVLIGTNDIGRMKCSKENVVRGIQNVIQMIHMNRPDTPIIAHALLPRSDHSYIGDNHLGVMYEKIIWINKALQQFCTLETNKNWCYYFNVNNIFLDESSTNIIVELMEDSLHPSVKGMDIWGPLLVNEIKKRIS